MAEREKQAIDVLNKNVQDLKKEKDEKNIKKDTTENKVKNIYNENINNEKFHLSILEDWTGLTACIEKVSKKTLIVAIVVYYKYYEIPGISQWSSKKYKHILVQIENTEHDFVKLILDVYEKIKEECIKAALV